MGYFVIALFLLDTEPLVNSYTLSPFYTSAPLLICLFLLGYTFNKSLVKKPEVKEPVEDTIDTIVHEEVEDNETIAL